MAKDNRILRSVADFFSVGESKYEICRWMNKILRFVPMLWPWAYIV